MHEQFESYEAFLEWLLASYPEGSTTTTTKGTGFRDYVARLLPETPRGRRFGMLKANPKHSHDMGVDVLSADPTTDQLALQVRFTISEKKHIDDIISGFENYERSLKASPGGQLSWSEGAEVALPIYGIATASRFRGIIAAYEASNLSSRRFYDRLKAEQRLDTWDGEDLRRDARQLNNRYFQLPLKLELTSAVGQWLHDGDVWLGVVQARDLVALEKEHGDGLFYENIRGFLGLEGGRDGETVNQAIKNTVVTAPEQMLARNNGVAFRASDVVPKTDGTLELREASIINGRQTTGALRSVDAIRPDCRLQVKVVRASRDAWAIADAANNQNRVARIELMIARYFRDQVVKRELAKSVSGSEWLETVVDEDRGRQELVDVARALLIGLFCHRPGQLADNNYSHIRWDVLDAFYEDGEPPPILFPTLFAVVRATDEAVAVAASFSDSDPLSQVAESGRPKYRAFLALLALAATHEIDLSEPLDDRDATVGRVRTFLERSWELIDNDPANVQQELLTRLRGGRVPGTRRGRRR